jgi:hypothetical protein
MDFGAYADVLLCLPKTGGGLKRKGGISCQPKRISQSAFAFVLTGAIFFEVSKDAIFIFYIIIYAIKPAKILEPIWACFGKP